jgi:hypothetical protein
MIETLDEGLFLILTEAMEELLEEHGYELDEVETLVDEEGGHD